MARRRGRRRVGGKRRRGRFYKSAVGKGEVMVNRTKARLHNVVAPHYLTKLEYGFTGSQTLAAGVQGYFNIWLNCLTFPGDPAGSAVGLGVDYTNAAFGGTLYPATHALAALEPVGYTQLSVLYERFRVFASKIQVTCQPVGAVDAMMCVLPVNGASLTVPEPGNDIQRAQSAPYAKFITCSSNNNIRQNTISMYMDAPTMLGLTKQQYKDDPNTGHDYDKWPGTNTGNAIIDDYPGAYWQVNVSPFAAGAVLSNNFEVRVTYWVECFEPVVPTDT